MKNKQEYILCAAILNKEPGEVIPFYHNQDLRMCQLGFRHADILFKFQGIVKKIRTHKVSIRRRIGMWVE